MCTFGFGWNAKQVGATKSFWERTCGAPTPGQRGAGRRARLTGALSRQLQLQLLHLPDQQGHVLQGIPVLQQELVHAGLRLQPRRRLRSQLVLQQVNLKQEAERRGGEDRA